MPVIKPTRPICLCDDYEVSVSPHLAVKKCPLPHPEEIFTVLNDGKKFTKWDLSEAYLQIPLDEQSRDLLVIIPIKGFIVLHDYLMEWPLHQQIMDQCLPKQEGTSIDVLPSKNQALCEYCAYVRLTVNTLISPLSLVYQVT